LAFDQAEILKKLQDEFKDAEVSEQPEYRIEITISKEKVVEVATFIKHELGFTIPNMCTGIDMKENMLVLWHIGTPDGPTLIIIKTETDREECTVPALTPTWIGMDWHERETYDLLGVKFENHPDLRRLIMPENWEGHPLREDYVYKKPIYRKPEDF
jgi:NADH-quinone oxidoreductase subunit C